MTESSMHNNISVVCRTIPQVCHGYISTCSLHVEFDNRHQLSFILDERTGLIYVVDDDDNYLPLPGENEFHLSPFDVNDVNNTPSSRRGDGRKDMATLILAPEYITAYIIMKHGAIEKAIRDEVQAFYNEILKRTTDIDLGQIKLCEYNYIRQKKERLQAHHTYPWLYPIIFCDLKKYGEIFSTIDNQEELSTILKQTFWCGNSALNAMQFLPDEYRTFGENPHIKELIACHLLMSMGISGSRKPSNEQDWHKLIAIGLWVKDIWKHVGLMGPKLDSEENSTHKENSLDIQTLLIASIWQNTCRDEGVEFAKRDIRHYLDFLQKTSRRCEPGAHMMGTIIHGQMGMDLELPAGTWAVLYLLSQRHPDKVIAQLEKIENSISKHARTEMMMYTGTCLHAQHISHTIPCPKNRQLRLVNTCEEVIQHSELADNCLTIMTPGMIHNNELLYAVYHDNSELIGHVHIAPVRAPMKYTARMCFNMDFEEDWVESIEPILYEHIGNMPDGTRNPDSLAIYYAMKHDIDEIRTREYQSLFHKTFNAAKYQFSLNPSSLHNSINIATWLLKIDDISALHKLIKQTTHKRPCGKISSDAYVKWKNYLSQTNNNQANNSSNLNKRNVMTFLPSHLPDPLIHLFSFFCANPYRRQELTKYVLGSRSLDLMEKIRIFTQESLNKFQIDSLIEVFIDEENKWLATAQEKLDGQLYFNSSTIMTIVTLIEWCISDMTEQERQKTITALMQPIINRGFIEKVSHIKNWGSVTGRYSKSKTMAYVLRTVIDDDALWQLGQP